LSIIGAGAGGRRWLIWGGAGAVLGTARLLDGIDNLVIINAFFFAWSW